MQASRGGIAAILIILAAVCQSVWGNADTRTQDGISIRFSVEGMSPADSVGGEHQVLALQAATISFSVTDANNTPLTGLYPAAWIHPSSAEHIGDDEVCLNKVKAFIGGSLLSRAELDLNVYYVMVLNQDATISVVDPLFGFGGSKLLTMLPLNGVGQDWVINPAQDKVFVSIPASNEIAVIDTNNWQVSHHQLTVQTPTVLALNPHQQTLWALSERGVAVLHEQSLQLLEFINTKQKPHALDFSEDGSFAYVLSDDSLQVIDVHSKKTLKQIALEKHSHSMAFSQLANNIYLTNPASGIITVVDGASHRVSAQIKAQPGITRLRFSPDGRWGFLVNPEQDQLSIIDAATNRIVQQGIVASQPEYIAFSDNLAYVRHANSFDLYMVPLDDRDLGREGAGIPTIDAPGGDNSPGKVPLPSDADSIVQAPGSNAVLIANYHDQVVYFYKEGMAAPMGQFSNYSKSPRAVLAVDHSLNDQHTAGTYSTSAVLPEAGLYEAVYFMDSPRAVHCFAFEINAQPGESRQLSQTKRLLQPMNSSTKLKVGERSELVFKLTGSASDVIATREFNADIILSSGLWRDRVRATTNPGGLLHLSFVPPLSGFYDVYITEQAPPGTPTAAPDNVIHTFAYEAQ